MDTDRAQGVIGGMYGDEGKGMLTCLLAQRQIKRNRQCTVVRFNSSAQAGHTVETQDQRHVFHHFGSGSLVGAATHLGPRFVLHPMLFARERAELDAKGGHLAVSADPRCQITTPYDMLLNQAIEQWRGGARHGSCGIGFGETIQRNEMGGISITLDRSSNYSEIRDILNLIRHQYVPQRLAALGIPADHLDQWTKNESLVERFMADLDTFLSQVKLATPLDVAAAPIVFEGAQGLALDEQLGEFPFVTRSKTGIPYLAEFCEEGGIESVDLHYGTRAYTTRHGAGPLPSEGMSAPPGFQDLTNVPNDYQGTLRFAPLDPGRLHGLIQKDFGRYRGAVKLRYGLWVSCLDQMGENTRLADGQSVSTQALPAFLREQGGEWMSEGWGAQISQWNLAGS